MTKEERVTPEKGIECVCAKCGHSGWFVLRHVPPVFRFRPNKTFYIYKQGYPTLHWQGTLRNVGEITLPLPHMSRSGRGYIKDVRIAVYAHDRRTPCPTPSISEASSPEEASSTHGSDSESTSSGPTLMPSSPFLLPRQEP